MNTGRPEAYCPCCPRRNKPLPHELEGGGRLRSSEKGFHLTPVRVSSESGFRQSVKSRLHPRVGIIEQTAVQPYLRVGGGGGVHPVNGSFNAAAVRRIPAAGRGVIFRQHLGHTAVGILSAGAPHDIRAFQPHFISREKPKISFHRFPPENLLFHPQAAEKKPPSPRPPAG